MVAAFLLAEIDSSRFGTSLRATAGAEGLAIDAVRRPDTTDPTANAARRRVLDACRPPGRDLFAGFPSELHWAWMMLRPDELASVRYIDWDYWVEVSAGSRLACDATVRLRHDPAVASIIDRLYQREPIPPLILVGSLERDTLVVLEGHLRLTAMMAAYEVLPAEVLLLLGTSPVIDRWPLFGSAMSAS